MNHPLAMMRGRLRLAVLTAACACVVPVVAAALSLSTQPAQPAAFEPFDVVVQYSREYCLPRATPIVSQVTGGATVSARTVTVVLSHLDVTDPVPCTLRSSSRLRVPGLPAGRSTLEVALTQTAQPLILGYRSEVVERGSLDISVSPMANAAIRVMTINGPNGAPFYLSTVDAQNLSGSGSLLPSTGAGASTPAFYAWSAARMPAPNVATRLFSLKFSSPVRYFYTTLPGERDALLRAGFIEQIAPSWEQIYVLPAANGACPLGATSVRRLFNQADTLHRYEMNMDTASVLSANGYVDENIAFCSPLAP